MIAGLGASRLWLRLFLCVIRSPQIVAFLYAQGGPLALKRLPANAPEFNPVEWVWVYLRHHTIPNIGDVAERTSRTLRCIQRRPTLLRAF